MKTIDGKLKTMSTFNFDDAFEVSYQNHEKICVTRKEIPDEKYLLKLDMVTLSADWLASHDSQLNIHVHLKGQFFRSLGKPVESVLGKDLFEGKVQTNLGFIYSVKAKINSVDILRKRHDADDKCNRTLKNDDRKWWEELFEKIQCQPPFMKSITNISNDQTNYPKCEKDQLYEIAFNYSSDDNFDAIARSYLPPCTEMSSVVTTTDSQKNNPRKGKQSLAVSFEYPSEYRETLNQREYGVYDLWSQIGGVMGIIVGCSLMHIPGSIEKALQWYQEYQSKRYEVRK